MLPIAGTSFSILLGDAPHLDMHYTVFGEMTQGQDVLAKVWLAALRCAATQWRPGLMTAVPLQFQELPTRTEGFFVMPLERVDIQATYVYLATSAPSHELCTQVLASLTRRFEAQSNQLERIRSKQLPG